MTGGNDLNVIIPYLYLYQPFSINNDDLSIENKTRAVAQGLLSTQEALSLILSNKINKIKMNLEKCNFRRWGYNLVKCLPRSMRAGIRSPEIQRGGGLIAFAWNTSAGEVEPGGF